MGRPSVVIELASDAQFAKDLEAGGVFVPAIRLVFNDEVDLVVKGGAGELCVVARVVYVDPAKGTGFELVGFGPALKDQLAQLATAPPGPGESDNGTDPDITTGDEAANDNTDETNGDEGGSPRQRLALNANERLRGINLADQIKVARGPSASERMVLERMYGKNVWEALLHNPGLTAPEVARLARLGSLPRPLLEIIVNNGSWLQVPEIRRALLGNPRLGTDQILRVLRLLPKHELKLAATIPTYPYAVRSAAKKMLED